MGAFFERVAAINNSVNGVVWGIFGLALLIGTGVIVTLSTKVFQVSHIGLWWKNTIASSSYAMYGLACAKLSRGAVAHCACGLCSG